MPAFPIALKCIHSDLIVVASEGNDLNIGFAQKFAQQDSRIFWDPVREHQSRFHECRSACRYHWGVRDVGEQALAAGFSKEHGQDCRGVKNQLDPPGTIAQDSFALSLGETASAHMRRYLRPDAVSQERFEPFLLSGFEAMGHEPLFALGEGPSNGLGLTLVSEYSYVGG